MENTQTDTPDTQAKPAISAESRFKRKGFIKETDNKDYVSYSSTETHDYVIFYKKKHHFETTAELDLAMLRACITQMKELGWEHRLNLD